MEEKKELKDWQIGLSWGIAFGMVAFCICMILHQYRAGWILLCMAAVLGMILYKPLKNLKNRR